MGASAVQTIFGATIPVKRRVAGALHFPQDAYGDSGLLARAGHTQDVPKRDVPKLAPGTLGRGHQA